MTNIKQFKRKSENFDNIDCEHIRHWSFTPVGSAQRLRSLAYSDYLANKFLNQYGE